MYNLNFIENIEADMDALIEYKNLYVQLKNDILKTQKEGMDIAERGEKITDENSKEYIELVEKANKIKERISDLGKSLKAVQKKFENIKRYIIENLEKNKEIIEKYKDVENDKDLNEFKDKLKGMDINKQKLDEKIHHVSEQISLNSLSKEEISKMNQEKRKEVLNAREQYLNNKKQLEKLEKIKYITLLGNEEPKKRIFQYESAIAYIDKQFSIENIEGVMEKLEETLGIQKQKPQVKFDLKKHTYTYIDERGKETVFENMFRKDEDGKYKSALTDENIKTTKQWAITNELSKRQIKAIDYNVVKVIQTVNPDLLNSYLEAIKDGKEADFSIEYNFKTKGIDKEEKIARKELRRIKMSANRQKMKGIATVIKDKSKSKFIGVMAALGLTSLTAAIAGNKEKLALDQGKLVEPIVGEMLGKDNKINDKINDIKNASKEEKDLKDEITVGDYIKISEGAMLFDNPTDELRIMNGLNATEKVQVKQSGIDRLYKINKEGYYSLNGDYVTVSVGQNLEEALKKKGLDKSFVENGNSVKMYHAVSDGISQWVRADDVEKVEIRTDKFGNPIDKTEEQKMADEAMENYSKEKNSKKEQTNINDKSTQDTVVNNEERKEEQQNVNEGVHLEEDVVDFSIREEEDVLNEGVKHKDSEDVHRKDEIDDKVPQDILDERIPHDIIDDDYIENDYIDSNHIENDELEVVTFERYDGEVVSENDFKKQYHEDVKKQYKNILNNKNTVIDVDAEIIDDEER